MRRIERVIWDLFFVSMPRVEIPFDVMTASPWAF